jgi:hypothetical protein
MSKISHLNLAWEAVNLTDKPRRYGVAQTRTILFEGRRVGLKVTRRSSSNENVPPGSSPYAFTIRSPSSQLSVQATSVHPNSANLIEGPGSAELPGGPRGPTRPSGPGGPAEPSFNGRISRKACGEVQRKAAEAGVNMATIPSSHGQRRCDLICNCYSWPSTAFRIRDDCTHIPRNSDAENPNPSGVDTDQSELISFSLTARSCGSLGLLILYSNWPSLSGSCLVTS